MLPGNHRFGGSTQKLTFFLNLETQNSLKNLTTQKGHVDLLKSKLCLTKYEKSQVSDCS